jgi:hypothetical protein
MPKHTATSAKQTKLEKKAPKAEAREVLYDEFKCSAMVGDKAMTEQFVKDLLGWESEQEFAARLMAENPGLKQDACRIPPDKLLLTDEEDQRVACWQNLGNRPFKKSKSDQYMDDFLNGRWKRNGESIIIGKTGLCISIQHRGTGFIRACQRWRKGRFINGDNAYPSMKTMVINGILQPVWEGVLVTGIDEDEETVMTIDDVEPRSVADVVMTGDMFAQMPSDDRQKAARSMKGAVEFLWRRLQVGDSRSNSAAVQFIRRHPALEPIVKHLVQENKGRALSMLRITGGGGCSCPGMCYLMASDGADGEKYHNTLPKQEPDLKQLDRAKLFFTLLAKDDTEVKAVVRALKALVDDPEGGGRSAEKLAILSKAWAVFGSKQRRPITDADVKLTYATNPVTKVTELIDGSNFGGIDLGEDPERSEVLDPPAPMTPEDLERRKAEARRAHELNHHQAPKPEKNTLPLTDAELLERRNKIIEARKAQKGDKP